MSTATHRPIGSLAGEIRGVSYEGNSWPLDRAYAFCREIATSHYENFPVGSLLVPRRLRRHFYSIYAFARIADDFADERFGQGHSVGERLEMLDWWHGMLSETDSGQATHPVFVALAATRSEFGLPLPLFEDLLSAFKQDVTVRRYSDFEQLLDYCRRSANPIGRLVLLLFGHRDEQLHSWSDDICTALQLTNHWQDVSVDLQKDRVYLPLEDLGRFELDVDEIGCQSFDERFRRLLKFEMGRARDLFDRGRPLCTAVGGRLGIELRAVWLGGVRILERIEDNGCDVFSRRPVITAGDKLGILYLALSKGKFGRY